MKKPYNRRLREFSKKKTDDIPLRDVIRNSEGCHLFSF